MWILKTTYSVGIVRYSVPQSRWHEELGGSTDIPAYLRFLHEDSSGFAGIEEGTSSAIAEDRLLDIVTIVGCTDRESVKTTLEDLRKEGTIVEDVDQHPKGNVYLNEKNSTE